MARGGEPQTPEEKTWYQAIVDQTKESSLMHRYGTIDEQVAPILFMASDESSYITGSVLPCRWRRPGLNVTANTSGRRPGVKWTSTR